MSREEQQAWALAGAGAVIIVLLLLDFGQPLQTTDVKLGPLIWPPFDPFDLKITKVPPNGYPFYLNVNNPDLTAPTSFLPGSPCACGCGEPLSINGLDLSQQMSQLNDMLRANAVELTTYYYAGEPPWATNADQIGALNNMVGLPGPF